MKRSSCWLSVCLVLAVTGLVVSGASESKDKFKDKTFVKVLYGSCHSTKLVSPLWPHIIGRNPDMWIWGGDNMYADRMLKDPLGALLHFKLPFEEANETSLIQSYRDLHADLGYTRLRSTGVEEIAIWDDHDYGINDGDRTYHLREASKRVFLGEMVRAPKDDPRWKQNGGIYLARTYNTKKGSFRVIGLDVRYSKDPWKSTPKDKGDMLGEEQWAWLEQTLCGDKTPRVNIIVSGLQILPENRGAGESWSLFPNSRQKLFNLLSKCQVKAPLLVSGDVHMAEMFESKCSASSFLPELTSSGMTHSWATRSPGWTGELVALNLYMRWLLEVAHVIMPWNYRTKRAQGAPYEGAYYLGLNFAEIDLDFDKEVLTAQVIGAENDAVLKLSWAFHELDVRSHAGDNKCEPIQGPESMIRLFFARGLIVIMFFFVPVFVFIVFPFMLVRKIIRVVLGSDTTSKKKSKTL